MRLALLCDDPAVVTWLDALAGSSVHEIVVAATVSPGASDLLRGRSGIRPANGWEELLIARDIDAVLVGGHEPPVLEAIKQLAAAGQPILFLPQAAQGSTFLYELSLIRDDNRVTLFPALLHRGDKALVRLRALLRDALPNLPLPSPAAGRGEQDGDGSSIGKVQLLQFERELTGNSATGALPQSIVDAALLGDIDLLRWLSGDYDQVTALRTGAANETVLMQTVTLAGRGLPEVTWHAQAASGAEVCRLTIHAERGRMVVERDPQSHEWTLTEPDGAKTVGDRTAAARGLLDEFAAGLSREDSSGAWSELVKAFETLDATRRSVVRRRTIELHFEPMSERAIFKTQMTAIGCGVLVGTFLLTLVYLAVASTIPLPQPVLLVLRTLVFAPLAVFLLLQVLFPLARPSATNKPGTNDAT